MKLRDAAKWIKEKITGKKTKDTPARMSIIATEEDIEKAKEMDRRIEEMEKKSEVMATIVTSQAEMERLQRFEEGSKQIAEMAGKTILLSVATLLMYILGMILYFHYQLKEGRTRKERTEEQKREDEEQIQAIREMQARKEEKRQKRWQRKSEINRR